MNNIIRITGGLVEAMFGTILTGIGGHLLIGTYQISVTELKRGHAYLLVAGCAAVIEIVEGMFRAFGYQEHKAYRNLALLTVAFISGAILTRASLIDDPSPHCLAVVTIFSGFILMKGLELFGQGVRGI